MRVVDLYVGQVVTWTCRPLASGGSTRCSATVLRINTTTVHIEYCVLGKYPLRTSVSPDELEACEVGAAR